MGQVWVHTSAGPGWTAVVPDSPLVSFWEVLVWAAAGQHPPPGSQKKKNMRRSKRVEEEFILRGTRSSEAHSITRTAVLLRHFRTDGPLMERVSSEPLHFQTLGLQSTSSPSPADTHRQTCCYCHLTGLLSQCVRSRNSCSSCRVLFILLVRCGSVVYLGSRFESGELWGSDVGSVVQQVVFCSLSGVQEVQTALVTAEHVLLLQRHKQNVRLINRVFSFR